MPEGTALNTLGRWTRRGGLLAIGAACLGSASAAGSAAVCQVGAVEMIVGGRGPDTCVERAEGADRRTASPMPARSGERVDAAVQRVRDSERRRILDVEVQREQIALADLLRRGDAANEAALARTRSNLAALRNEIARTAP